MMSSLLTRPDDNIMANPDAHNIKLDATHSHMLMRLAEIKFDKRHTIGEVKAQLERRFGSAVESQELELRSSAGETICLMDDDTLTLGDYGATQG